MSSSVDCPLANAQRSAIFAQKQPHYPRGTPVGGMSESASTAYTKPSPAKMGYFGILVDTRLTGRMIHLSTWAEHRVFLTLYPITSRLCAAPPSFLSSVGKNPSLVLRKKKQTSEGV